MGFSTALRPLFLVEYRAQVGPLIEDEYVHVFGGVHDGAIAPDPLEVDAFRWTSLADLDADMANNPGSYTAWFLEYLRLRHANIAAFLQSR